MERLMGKKESGGLMEGNDASRNKQNSIATLNNDLQPHNNGFDEHQINQDIYTPNNNSASEF